MKNVKLQKKISARVVFEIPLQLLLMQGPSYNLNIIRLETEVVQHVKQTREINDGHPIEQKSLGHKEY